jgi:hypothetical protein
LIYTVKLQPTVHDTQIEFHVNFKKWVTVQIIYSCQNYTNLIANIFHCGKYLTKYFYVCSLFRFVTLQSYLPSVTIRACDVCITLKSAFWKCMWHWFTLFQRNVLSIQLVSFVYMETNLIALHKKKKKIVNSLIMKLYNFT